MRDRVAGDDPGCGRDRGGCHWPFRKARPKDWPKLFQLLLTGRSVKAAAAVGWLIDAAGPLDIALRLYSNS